MFQYNIKTIIKFNILFLFTCCNTYTTKTYFQDASETEHLKNERIKDICGKIDDICSSSHKHLCTVRMVKGKVLFKEFENNCYLFLYNMCVYPGNEWAIKEVGSCKNKNLRRFAEKVEKTTKTDTSVKGVSEAVTGNITEDGTESTTGCNTKAIADENTEPNIEGNPELTTGTKPAIDDIETKDDNTEVGENTGGNTELTGNETIVGDFNSTVKLGLRAVPKEEYVVTDAPDGHKCPSHCPSVYFPVCVNINRGMGKYYRLLFFVNHCEADRHYCMHWATMYKPPPNEYEMVRPPSNAAWSYCAGNKYMNFATFAESAASMGHYGWLMGDQRPSHIMEPYERVPGFG